MDSGSSGLWTRAKEWQVGKFRIQLAIQDWFRLDGGIVFGGVPKEKWRDFSMGVSTLFDERNRVQLSVNCFLITTPEGRKILVDTSFGAISRWKKETIEGFHMQNGFNLFERHHPHRLQQPDIVIPTHLHFDHAGGCARRVGANLWPAFSNAAYLFHEDEIKHALEAHPKTRSSYMRETVDGINKLLELGRVSRVGGEIIFLGERGLHLLRTRGHTPGHLSVKIESEGQIAFIPGALCPTRWHINVLGCGVGNDTHGKEAVDHKMRFLPQAVEENWLLLLEHDPDVAGRIVGDDNGNFKFTPLGV